MRADLAQLETVRAFVTAAKHGKLRDAAVVLGRTQPALSMALGQLEQALDRPFFEIDRKRYLTDSGQSVRNAGEERVRKHDGAMDLIHGYAKGETGHPGMASVLSVAAMIVPQMLGAGINQHVGARVDLMDRDSTNARRIVAMGHADV